MGERIGAAPGRVGLSKSELGRRCGKGYRTIHAWIQGDHEPGGENIRTLAEALGVTADELLGIMDGQEPPFPAWRTFRETAIGRALAPSGVRALAGFAWPDGEQPTVAAYTLLAQALGLTEPREG